MAARQQKRSFSNTSLDASGFSPYNCSGSAPELQTNRSPMDSNPQLDSSTDFRRRDQHRNQPSDLVQSLLQHQCRSRFLPAIISLLKMTNMSWDCIRHLRNHKETATSLEIWIPQLYQVPEEIFDLLHLLRSCPGWEAVKDEALKVVEAGRFPTSKPGSVSSFEMSETSSVRSKNSTIQSINENLDPIESNSTYTSSPKPNTGVMQTVVVKQEDEYWCFSLNCLRSYKKPYNREGNLRNHVLKHHPGSEQAKAMLAPQAMLAPPASTLNTSPWNSSLRLTPPLVVPLGRTARAADTHATQQYINDARIGMSAQQMYDGQTATSRLDTTSMYGKPSNWCGDKGLTLYSSGRASLDNLNTVPSCPPAYQDTEMDGNSGNHYYPVQRRATSTFFLE